MHYPFLALCVLLAFFIPIKIQLRAFLNLEKNIILVNINAVGISILKHEFEIIKPKSTLKNLNKENQNTTNELSTSYIKKFLRVKYINSVLSGNISFINNISTYCLISLISLTANRIIKHTSNANNIKIRINLDEQLFNFYLNFKLDGYIKIKMSIVSSLVSKFKLK
jgi:hypothetical protein